MQLRDEHLDRLALAHGVLPADDGVLKRLHGVRGGRRPQAQAFVEHLADVRQLADVPVCRLGRVRVAPQRVDLGLSACEHLRVLGQVVQGEGQGTAGGLVAGDEERDRLVADVDVVQALARDGVLGVQHPPEQVVGALVTRGPALSDHVVDQVLHQGHVGAELLGLPPLEQIGAGDGRPLGLGEAERPGQGGDEGVGLLAAEGLEVVAEAAQTDRVEGQPCHVVGDVHGLRAGGPVPLADQFTGDLEHRRVVAAHGAEGERGHQDVVRLAPVGLVVERGEESVAADLPEDDEVGVHVLAEPALVRQLGDEVEAGGEVDLGAEDAELEQRPQLLGLLHHVEQAVGATGDVKGVADQRQGGTLGDRLGSARGLVGHGLAFRSAQAVAGQNHTSDLVMRQGRSIVLVDIVD